jgi:uncharacterized protein (TIGR03083 family)
VPSPADATIAALRSGHDDLAAIVAGLSADDLTTQSVATEWDVSQVISHLGSGAVIGLEALEASIEGRPNRGTDYNKEVWARWDGMSPAERQTEFVTANAAIVERYEGLDEATRNSLEVDLGFLPQPIDVKTAGNFRLNEFALHSWDVRATFDPTAAVRPEAVEPLLEQAAFLLGWVAKADRLGRTATVAVTTTAPDRTFGLAVADAVSVGDAPDSADATLALPAESWLRLVTGRLRPEHTPAAAQTTGAVDLDDLRRVFPGF